MHLAILTSPLPAEDKPLIMREVDALLDAVDHAPNFDRLDVRCHTS